MRWMEWKYGSTLHLLCHIFHWVGLFFAQWCAPNRWNLWPLYTLNDVLHVSGISTSLFMESFDTVSPRNTAAASHCRIDLFSHWWPCQPDACVTLFGVTKNVQMCRVFTSLAALNLRRASRYLEFYDTQTVGKSFSKLRSGKICEFSESDKSGLKVDSNCHFYSVICWQIEFRKRFEFASNCWRKRPSVGLQEP